MKFSVAAHGGGEKRRGAATVRSYRRKTEVTDLGYKRGRTRSAIAFHLWRETGFANAKQRP